MKTHLKYLAIAVLALAACNKETVQQFEKKSLSLEKPTDALILKAHYDQPSSKSAISDAGAFTWTDGDEISVWTRNKNKSLFMTYSLLSGAGTNDAEFGGGLSTSSVSKVAVFPAALAPSLPSNQSTSLTITLPNEYDYVESVTNSPMIAQVTDAQTPLSFKHLAGLIKLTVDNIPSTASVLYFTTPGVKISGSYTISDYTAPNASLEAAAGASDGSDEYVEINFTPTGGPMTFYVPLPVGNYEDGFIMACFDANDNLVSLPYYYEKPFSVERADLLLAPTATLWAEANDILASYDGPYKYNGQYYSAFSFLTAGPYFKYAIIPYSGSLSIGTLLSIAEYVTEDEELELYSSHEYPLYNLPAGSYVAFMVAFDAQGNCLYTYSYALAEVVEIPEESSAGYKKWLGTWSISGIDFLNYWNGTLKNITFSGITISEDIPDYSFTVAHWESTTNPASDYNWDTAFGPSYQPTFTARYDAASGKLIFVAETITGFTMSGQTYYLSFNDYWLYNDGDQLAEATLAANGATASVSPLNDCYTLGYYILDSSWSPFGWGYTFYLGPQRGRINPVPMTMQKTSSSTSSTGAPIALQSASAPRRVIGKERKESLSVSLPSLPRKELPAALKKK